MGIFIKFKNIFFRKFYDKFLFNLFGGTDFASHFSQTAPFSGLSSTSKQKELINYLKVYFSRVAAAK